MADLRMKGSGPHYEFSDEAAVVTKNASIRFLILMLTILLWPGDVRAGSFEGKSLVIDTQIEAIPPIVNDGDRSLSPVASGELVPFDLFVRDGDGLSISGISLVFENTPVSGDLFSFSSFFSIHSVEGLVGQGGEVRGPITTVFNGGGRTIGANEYIATVKLRALRDIPPGTNVRVEASRTHIIDGRTGARDSVSVKEARFLIANTDFVLSLDLDATPGDQGRALRFGVVQDSEVKVEIHGKRISNAVGFIMEFVVEPGLTFESFEPANADSNGVFGGASSLPADTTGASITVTVADTVDVLRTDSGLIGNMVFSPDADLREASVSLVRGEMLRRGQFLFSGTGTVRVTSSIDFDDSGVTDFRDFLLFAAAFGRTDLQPEFDGKFDLNANGTIEFLDLVVLSGIFEEALGGTEEAAP
jgi:hypothetical protein